MTPQEKLEELKRLRRLLDEAKRRGDESAALALEEELNAIADDIALADGG